MFFTATAPTTDSDPPTLSKPRAASMDSPTSIRGDLGSRSQNSTPRSLSFPTRPSSSGSSLDSGRRVHFEGQEGRDDDGMSAFGLSSADSFGPARSMVSPTSTLRASARPRSRTAYQIAQPPPRASNHHKIRSKLLLQLQKLSTVSRPTPALDVLPSSACPRAMRRMAKKMHCKSFGGPSSIAIVRSEEYAKAYPDRRASAESDESEEDASEIREAVAFINPLGKAEGGALGKARICFSTGEVWEAAPLRTNNYEFTHVDPHGHKTTARWVSRSPNSRQKGNGTQDRAYSITEEKEKRFNFSLMNPHLRRHPIIASMDRQHISVLDSYRNAYAPGSPALVSSPISPTSPLADADVSSYFGFSGQQQDPTTTSPVDDELRNLILITGIWVAFRENWSQNFRYDDPVALKKTSQRPTSMPPGGIQQLQQQDVADDRQHHHLHHVGTKILRSGSNILHRRSSPPKTGTAATAGTSPSPMSSSDETENAPVVAEVRRPQTATATGMATAPPRRHTSDSQSSEEKKEVPRRHTSPDFAEPGSSSSSAGSKKKATTDGPEKKGSKWASVVDLVKRNTCGHR